jgi:very-short-patch-repair endonuclease
MRREMIEAEERLRSELRNRRLDRIKFRRLRELTSVCDTIIDYARDASLQPWR